MARDISLALPRGCRHALIGPNGAGKTTTFNLISGRFPLSAGEVRVMGRRVTLNGEPLELTTCEYELLVYMMHNAHRVISPQELVQVVRQYECDHLQEARDVIKWYIYRLRRKVEPNPTRPRHILNVRGVGYTFKE